MTFKKRLKLSKQSIFIEIVWSAQCYICFVR